MKTLVTFFAAILVAYTVSAVPANDNKSASHTVTVKIPAVAMVGLSGSNIDFELSPVAPGQAGGAIGVEATNSNTWLNYSSVVAANQSRNIKVAMSQELPAGISLEVAASAYTGQGKGTTGTVSSKKTLSTSAQEIVTGIGSCYTGTGANNGHQLTYSLKLNNNDYASIKQLDHNITVTYTISE